MSEYALRRNKLLKKMKEGSVAIIFAGALKVASEDDFFPFVVNRNFYYLTGIKQENSILLMVKGIGSNKEYLFIDPFNPVQERWTGKKLTNKEAGDISDMQNVYSTDNFESILSLVLGKEGTISENVSSIYVDLKPEIKIKQATSTKDFAKELEEKYRKEIIDVYPLIMRLRMIKSDEEIENIRKAINRTNIGINQMIMKLQPGIYEYELADLFEFNGRINGKSTLAFDTIVGAGINSTCLHYPNLDSKIKEDDIILFDLGYTHDLYCADISRTYPVKGVYSPLQRNIYEAVLNCNKAVIAYIREGLTIKDLQDFATEFLKNECIRRKLMKPGDDIKKYYIHNVSHHLGLDTHDISDREIPLEKGNVITVEPGLYFPEYQIGVRIEDDVLVTDSRAEVLSSSIIKEIADIEKLFKTKR